MTFDYVEELKKEKYSMLFINAFKYFLETNNIEIKNKKEFNKQLEQFKEIKI